MKLLIESPSASHERLQSATSTPALSNAWWQVSPRSKIAATSAIKRLRFLAMLLASLLALILAPSIHAADGDLCASQGYSMSTNAPACVVACDDAAGLGSAYQCNSGAELAPRAGYRGGTVRVEIGSTHESSCWAEVYERASSSRRHYLGTLHCGSPEARVTIPTREHVAGGL